MGIWTNIFQIPEQKYAKRQKGYEDLIPMTVFKNDSVIGVKYS